MAGLSVVTSVMAKDWAIPSPKVVGNETAVIALTNALLKASNNDTVTLSNGVYKLKGVIMRADAEKGDSHLHVSKIITLRGDPAEDRENIVLEGGGQEDNARIIYLEQRTAVFENLNFTNGYCSVSDGGVSYYNGGGIGDCGHFTNCVFRGNAGKAGGTVRGAKMSDCLVENNWSVSGYGGGAYRVEAHRTKFINNKTANGGCVNQSTIYDCEFIGNTSTKGAAVSNTGGPFYNCSIISNVANSGSGALASCSLVSNCTFLANHAKSGSPGAVGLSSNGCVYASRFYNNYSDGYAAGAIQGHEKGPGRVYDCIISNNVSDSFAGAGLYIAVWSNCTFVANSVRTDGTDGRYAGVVRGTLYNCTFRGHYNTTMAGRVGDATIPVTKKNNFPCYASAVNANLIDCDISGAVIGGSLVRCVLHDSDDLNQIVSGGTALTNCVIRNNCRKTSAGVYTGCNLFSGHNSADPQLVNCTVVGNVAQIFYGNPKTVALNTIFYGNLYDDGTTKSDISCDNTNLPYLTNCLFQAMDKKPTPNRSACVQLEANETPKFNEGQNPAYPYYMPRHSSRAVGAGSGAVAWTTDLGGYSRHEDGSVDIGAYQCWIPAPGLLLLFR